MISEIAKLLPIELRWLFVVGCWNFSCLSNSKASHDVLLLLLWALIEYVWKRAVGQGGRTARELALAYNEEVERLLQPDVLERGERSDLGLPLVFLDANVILGYLRGDPSTAQLFSAEADGRLRFAINPIVLQEILLGADAAGLPEFERISGHLRVLPVDFAKAEALVPRARALRNRLVHANDILILSSADECDFLVTRDGLLKNLIASERPQVVTPEEVVIQLRAA